MNCTKCGKEIPEGENKLCEECQRKLISEIEENGKTAEVKKDRKDKKNNKIEGISHKFKILKENFVSKNKKTTYSFLAIAILVIALTMILINIVGSGNVGNSIGNIRNYGYAVEKSGWIYYLAPNEEGTQTGIFKAKVNKKDVEPIEILMRDWDSILSINVEKDYIYFIAILPEVYSEEDELDNKIYRMKTDGSGLEVINDNEFNNDCYEIYVVNNKIYYIGTDSNIYKMNLDGSNKEMVSENGTGYLGITDKYIIYNAEVEDQTDYVTCIMDLDGENSRPIIENTRLYSVNIYKDYIYYTNENKQICKVKLDGTDMQILYETTAYNMNTAGKYIYYLNYVDEENKDYTICIYRVKADGSSEEPEKIKQFDTYSTFINIVDDWVIYMDYNDEEGFIEIVKIDGTEEKRLYTLKYEEYYSDLAEVEESTATESTTETENGTVDNNVVEDTNTIENDDESVENTITEEISNEASIENETNVEDKNEVSTDNTVQ